MADDPQTTDHDGASNNAGVSPAQTPQSSQASEPEARILEEVIIKKHSVAAAPQKNITPPVPVSTSLPPPITVPPVIERIPQTPPSPLSTPPVTPAPSPVLQPSVLPVPPRTSPENVAQPEAQRTDIQADIQSVLKDIKLPERREQQGAPNKTFEVKSFDTMLGADAKRDIERPAQSPETRATEVSISSATVAKALTLEGTGTDTHEPQGDNRIASVHTLKDDLRHVVHDQKISLVRAVSLEENRRSEAKADGTTLPEPSRPKRHIGIIVSIVLLVLLGCGALFGVYSVERARATAPASQPDQSSILFAEKTITFSIDNQSPSELKQALAQSLSTAAGGLGSITRIIPTVTDTGPDGTQIVRNATFTEFMHAIGANPPDELVRALSDNFFFGVHTVDTDAPVIVVPVTSYDHAFAGMLSWESTLNADLSPIFTGVSAETTDASGLPIARTFTDTVMRNFDTRTLNDDQGNVVMYYSFPTQNILIIAESEYTFTEVLSRLQAQQQL